METPLFPIKIPANETRSSVTSCRDFREVFLEAIPDNLSWFAYDVTILSPYTVKFDVYKSFMGTGIGDLIWSGMAGVMPEKTLPYIKDVANNQGRMRYYQEQKVLEDKIVERYAQEILEGYGLKKLV